MYFESVFWTFFRIYPFIRWMKVPMGLCFLIKVKVMKMADRLSSHLHIFDFVQKSRRYFKRLSLMSYRWAHFSVSKTRKSNQELVVLNSVAEFHKWLKIMPLSGLISSKVRWIIFVDYFGIKIFQVPCLFSFKNRPLV